MTPKQHTHFYLRAWARAADHNDWRMAKGRLVGQPSSDFSPGAPDLQELHDAVWLMAGKCAAAAHRAVTPDDLRHGCHRVALGHDKSSKTFTNAEVDRVVSLFKILADPDDLDAVLNYLHPENAERERLLYSIERAPAAYAQRLCRDKFGTTDWHSLELEPLRQLAMTLRQRQGRGGVSNQSAEASGQSPSVPSVPSVPF